MAVYLNHLRNTDVHWLLHCEYKLPQAMEARRVNDESNAFEMVAPICHITQPRTLRWHVFYPDVLLFQRLHKFVRHNIGRYTRTGPFFSDLHAFKLRVLHSR